MKQLIVCLLLNFILIGCSKAPNPASEHSAQDFFDQGNAEFQNGEYSSAIGNFSQCVERVDHENRELRWSAYGMLGLCWYETEEYEEGIIASTKALEAAIGMAADEVIARLYYQRAMMHRALQNTEKEEADFRDAHQYDPERQHDPLLAR